MSWNRGTLGCLENPLTRGLSGPSSSSQLRDPRPVIQSLAPSDMVTMSHVLPARANQHLHHAELLIVLNANIDSLEVGKVSRAPLLGSVGPPGLFLRVVGFSGPASSSTRPAHGDSRNAPRRHVAYKDTRHQLLKQSAAVLLTKICPRKGITCPRGWFNTETHESLPFFQV